MAARALHRCGRSQVRGMTPSPLSVVKIGGSLADHPARLRRMLGRIAEGQEGAAVIVPGGGPFAEAVRTAQGSLGFPDALAHRFAVDAMAQMAAVFRAIEPRLALAESEAAIMEALHGGGCPVWLPTALRAGHPDIPESWDVTSDSLALWLARRLGAARCVLVKSAPCPEGGTPDEWTRLGLVDRAFPDFAARFSGKIHLRGPRAEASA